MSNRKHYDHAFKVQAVKLALEIGLQGVELARKHDLQQNACISAGEARLRHRNADTCVSIDDE